MSSDSHQYTKQSLAADLEHPWDDTTRCSDLWQGSVPDTDTQLVDDLFTLPDNAPLQSHVTTPDASEATEQMAAMPQMPSPADLLYHSEVVTPPPHV